MSLPWRAVVSRTSTNTLLFLWIVSCAAPCLAQNLITNPGFDDGLNGWTTSGASWLVIMDAGDPCASVEVYEESASIWQCVPATADAYYRYGGMFRRASGTLEEATLQVTFFGEPGCTGLVSGPDIHLFALSSSWHVLQGFFQAPSGTQSLRILISTTPVGQGILLIDELQLDEALFADDFETGTPGNWSRVVDGT